MDQQNPFRCDCPVLSKIETGAYVRFRPKDWKLKRFAELRLAGKSVQEAADLSGGIPGPNPWKTGRLTLVWLALDEWCGDVTDEHMVIYGIIPSLGDEIEPWEKGKDPNDRERTERLPDEVRGSGSLAVPEGDPK